MLSAQRLREIFSTLRFRLIVWITLVVLLMEVITSMAVREIVHRTLRYEYDQFLEDSLKDVQISIRNLYPHEKKKLFATLEDKARAFQYRGWFVELYDSQRRLLWSSVGERVKHAPIDPFHSETPFDASKHRVLEGQASGADAEMVFIRCGFFQLTLEEDIDLLNRVLFFGGLAILLAAPVGGYVIALRATRPISKIIATTAKLQPSNMNERLPIRGTGDEIDQLSQTINGMLDRLASYLNHNRDFVANAAHELRSPLAAIRSSVEVALNRSRSPDEYAAILSDVMEEIGRLVGLVNRLLILAEGDAGRLADNDHVAHLDRIVRESVDMFDAVAESQGVRLTVSEVAPALVAGDEGYLRQVVRNLIDNAIKYNKNPGEVVVGLSVDAARKQAVLSVRDTGVGIAREVLPRIFDRFYRADRSRSREHERASAGLGLSICETIVKALGGEILVESEVGRGSTFSVRLPLADAPGPQAQG